MTTLHLDDSTVDALRRRAHALGLSLESYLRTLGEPAEPSTSVTDPVAEFDTVLDELFATDTRPLPADALTYSREDIYIDHD